MHQALSEMTFALRNAKIKVKLDAIASVRRRGRATV
jgi:hypothetical protein